METFDLPGDLMLGTATAATHIEGGEQNHNWYRWSEQGKIKDGSHSKAACDHINRIESDVVLIVDLNCQTYRMGLEWSRIEPEEGEFSEEGIALYRKEIQLLIDKEVKPLVTLWHFSNPLWMEDDGGWVNPLSVSRFQNYVAYVIEQLGDLVTDWITINEPNVYLFFGYFDGVWPPGHQGDIKGFLKGARHLVIAHQRAYELIHSYYTDANQSPKVGVAHHLRIFDPIDKRLLSKMAAKLQERVFQNVFLEAMTLGEMMFPLTSGNFKMKEGLFADFIGVNYYSRDMIKGVWKPFELFGERCVSEEGSKNDLGWEIHPEGLGVICEAIYEKYKLPIYITENGTCDKHDAYRSKFIYDHLKALSKIIESGVDVQRYYHWSLLDNFEWAEGNSARFGLYHTNYKTQERTLRESGRYYAEICKNRSVLPPS
ncbi:MAG: family 1 glycosylhydrolase [Cyclobacteriaceae bacterium]